MEVASLPGLAMATVENGEVIWTKSLGVTNTDTRAPMRDDSVFEAASLSKPVFAYVVLKLADEKVLGLDHPLVKYHRPEYLADHPDIDRITARDVLRHSTGLPNWRNNPADKLTPTFKPGSRFGYSGEGFFWLQLVVERLTGKGIDSVMRSRLFEPAGMKLSSFSWNAELARLAVHGHRDEKPAMNYKREMGDRFLAIAAKWYKPLTEWTYDDVLKALPEARALTEGHPLPEDIVSASIEHLKLPDRVFPNVAGGLSTTVAEYARFIALMLERPKRAAWEIAETRRRAMLSRQIMAKANALYWGLGWALELQSAGLLFFHSGNNGRQFRTFCLGDPQQRRAIVIFTNGAGGDRVYQRIVRAATGYDCLEFLL